MTTQFSRFVSPLLVSAAALSITASTPAGPKKEEHFDVWLRIVDGDLITGSIDEEGTPLDPVWQVFGAELGEDPKAPFSATEPGFQLEDGTVTPGTAFTFLLDRLQVWNGNGFDNTNATVTLEFGPQQTTSRTKTVVGFNVTADGLGGFHDHFDITINGDGGDPADGVYLIPLRLAGVTGSYGATETFWFVMNLNMPEETHEASTDWVTENLAGEASVPCDSDTDGNGDVNIGDLINVITSWGLNGCP